jgi:hypothetical protein
VKVVAFCTDRVRWNVNDPGPRPIQSTCTVTPGSVVKVTVIWLLARTADTDDAGTNTVREAVVEGKHPGTRR